MSEVIREALATDNADELAEQIDEVLREYDREGIGDAACRNCGRTAHFEVSAQNERGYERYCAVCAAILFGEAESPPDEPHWVNDI